MDRPGVVSAETTDDLDGDRNVPGRGSGGSDVYTYHGGIVLDQSGRSEGETDCCNAGTRYRSYRSPVASVGRSDTGTSVEPVGVPTRGRPHRDRGPEPICIISTVA